MLWLILISMTIAAMATLAWPLLRPAGLARSGSDRAVYRDQLDEVDRDLGSGLISASDAEAARIEVSRRLLKAKDVPDAAPPVPDERLVRRRRYAVLATGLLAVPVVAGALYLHLGSPEFASAAGAAHSDAAADADSVEAMVAQVETHLQRKPDDGRAWEILGPVYMRLGRYEESAKAWQNALTLLGEDANRQESLGESLVAVANGIVTTEAKAAFDRAVAIDGDTVAARYYLGVAAEQDGRRDEAAKIWNDLVAAAPEGARWVGSVREALARLDGKPGLGQRGPTPHDIQEGSKLPPERQDEMIRGMVDRLAARLKTDGGDLDGWIRLVRSYKVLGEPDKASAAVAEARRALAADPEKLSHLEEAVKSLEAPPGAEPDPGRGAVAAVESAPPEQQSAMIRGMVDRLAARLKTDGGDLDGWVRLVRSYKVMGEPDKASAAVAEARRALAGDPDKLRRLEEGAKDLGVAR